MPSRFGPRRTFIATKGSALNENDFFKLGGLNLYAPDETMNDSDSPYGRNFRIFKEDSAESRVSLSKRNGHTFYSVPIGETDRGSITSVAGASDKAVTTVSWIAQPFTVNAAGRLTKLTLNLKNDNTGTAPLLVKIYSDVNSAPGALLATSSIASSSIATTYGYLTARFIEAPVVATATTYWIVIGQQSEGTGDYKLSTNTSATTALVSNTSGNSWATTAYAINYHAYVSTDKSIKSIYRYYRTTASPVTLFVHDTVLYSVNDSTGATTIVGTGLNSTATDYRWITVEDIVYFVNGYDVPKKYDGTTMSSVGGNPGNSFGVGVYPVDITLHKNLIFILYSNNAIIWSIEDNSSWEVFESDAIQYIPSPKPGDKAFKMVSFQDNLVCFTRNTKWVLYGYDRATFQLRESTSTKGAVGPNAIWRDESFIYFISDNNDVYSFNGGTDKSLGIKISREIENIADLTTVHLIVHNGKLRIYYAPTGQAYLQNCLVYDMMYEQWSMDTEIYTGVPYVFNSQSDVQVLVHGSSLVGAIYYAESGTSDLGKPIIFDYWTKYFSFDHPSRKHRIKRLYPLFRAGNGPYYVTVGVDTDYADAPVLNQVYLGTAGAIWGGGSLWGSTVVWGGDALEPTRLSVPGQARRHQIRFTQHGVDNPVDIIGFSTYTKIRRPI
jgi:hypothetical protein